MEQSRGDSQGKAPSPSQDCPQALPRQSLAPAKRGRGDGIVDLGIAIVYEKYDRSLESSC